MSELIWIGNTLYPRWFVFAVIALVLICVTGLILIIRHWVKP